VYITTDYKDYKIYSIVARMIDCGAVRCGGLRCVACGLVSQVSRGKKTKNTKTTGIMLAI
jgi:hypothetical protein